MINSVEFSDYDGCSEAGVSLQCQESMVDSEFFSNPDELSTKGNFSDNKSWNKSNFSECSQINASCEDYSERTRQSYIPTKKGIVKLEIADKDIREQMNKQIGFHNRSFFLDKANTSATGMTQTRSHSQNMPCTPTALQQNKPFDLKSCNYEIELREKVLSSKRILLRNFFSCYLKSLIEVNANLNASYIAKLREEYCKLRMEDKFSLRDLQESIEEMEVDEMAKSQIFDLLSQHTNCTDLIKSSAE